MNYTRLLEMIKKRKEGERGEILFDFVDLEALIHIAIAPLGVLELASKLKIKHKNLKNHIDKLERFGLIKKENVPKSRKVLLSLSDQGKRFLEIAKQMVEEKRKG